MTGSISFLTGAGPLFLKKLNKFFDTILDQGPALKQVWLPAQIPVLWLPVIQRARITSNEIIVRSKITLG
jgi:hypothetical protein